MVHGADCDQTALIPNLHCFCVLLSKQLRPRVYRLMYTRLTQCHYYNTNSCTVKMYYNSHTYAYYSTHYMYIKCPYLGPVVQSIVSLTSSLRGQLVKYFMTLLLNTLIFFVEKMREAFALQKLHTFFQQKMLDYFRY